MTETAKQDSQQDSQGSDDKKWYVIQTMSGYEKTVERTLMERVQTNKLQKKIDEVLIPEEEIEELRGGRKHRSKRKFYPGYLLVHMAVDNETWHFIRGLPHVRGFVGGTQDNPISMAEEEVERIKMKVTEGLESPRPKVLYEPGNVVRVINGPFKDFNAVIEEVNYEKNSLQVSIQIFGRSTPLALDFSEIEKT